MESFILDLVITHFKYIVFDKTSIYLIEYFILENNSHVNDLLISILKSDQIFNVIKNKNSCNLLEKVR